MKRMKGFLLAIPCLTLALHANTAKADNGPTGKPTSDSERASAQQFVVDKIDKGYQKNAKTARQIWEWAELGYVEHKSSALLQSRLARIGFGVDAGVAEMPTAFVASYGEGKPIVAFLAEFDALPGISQSDSATRDPITDKDAGHACGHHLLGTGAVAAASAVRDWLKKTGTPGTIRVYGTPAEEGGSGKVYMVRAGLFDDVDVVFDWHPSDRNAGNLESNLANRSAKFRFQGVSSHAAGAPDRGRSALDGVEAMNIMVNMLREHIPQESRIHYVITEGGDAPNVVPDSAEVYYYIRHPKPETLEQIWQRLVSAANGAAMGTETKVAYEIIHGNRNLLGNRYLQTLIHQNLHSFGGVTYSEEEQAFAQALYTSLDNPTRKIGSQAQVQAFREVQAYGSTDVGDVSWAAPTARVRVATWVPGTAAHSWQAIAAGGMEIGFKGMQSAAKVLAASAVDVFITPEHVVSARKEFDERRGPNFVYRAMLGDRDPPLDYRVKSSGD